MGLYAQGQSEGRVASEILGVEDATTAYVLNRAVWVFGSFVENEVAKFQGGKKETGSGKTKKTEYPTSAEVREYRRSLIEQTPYNKRAATKRTRKTVSLAEFARMHG